MIIKELGNEDSGDSGGRELVSVKAKKVLVGAGARILFYPTLIYNVLRNKMQAEFRWWDQIDQFILLGAVPFPKDVPRLKQLGVRGVITLNEPYETLVPSDLYKVHGIDHLVIPTRDYLFAPSLVDICRAVDFIYRNASRGRTTYVHCKAGRGRSTTIVLCYLIEYKNMTPMAALDYVRSRRPRVLLAPSQWQAVQEYGRHKLEFPAIQNPKPTTSLTGDEVLITADDFEGYSVNGDSNQRISSCNAAKSRTIIMRHALTSPLGGDEVLMTETDLEGYETVLDACNEKSISSYQNNWTIIVRHAPRSSLGGDEVLITEADLEGYETFVDSDEKSIFSNQNNQTRPMMRKLSFLFTSLKFSTSPKPVAKLAPYNSCLIGCHTNSCLSFNVREE